MDSKYPTELVATDDVEVGDQLVFLIADSDAYPTVEGWEDGSYRQSVGTYRDFLVGGDLPWWVTDDFLRSSRSGEVLIVARRTA